MFLSILYLVGGLILILAGANFLTDGASAMARRMGVSDLVVGLTVVAFGTSAPELAISVISAVNGSAELAVGNVVGSNIFNILMIIGVTAMVRPMPIGSGIMTKEIPLVILSSAVLLVMGNAPVLDAGFPAAITRVDGIVLLMFFAIFMRYTFSQAKQSDNLPEPAPAATPEDKSTTPMPWWKSSVWVAGGLAALIFGGDRFVAGASDIAGAMGVSDAVIALTIVACGTSLPELATSVAAALKGKPGIAIGNVIGSNIFNVFMVLGVSATITPLQLGAIGNVDFLTLLVASVLFWLFGWTIKKRTITRGEGAVMVICYIGYIAWLVANA